MDNVYKINNEVDDFVNKIREELISSDNGNNTDMEIVFQGYLHNKSGFKLKAENIEVFSDNLIHTWKSLIENQGMHADITADLSNAWVQITCKKVLRKRRSILFDRILTKKMPKIPFTLLLYICVLILLIIVLWQRHKEKFLN